MIDPGSAWSELAGIDPQSVVSPFAATYGDRPILVFRTEEGFRGVQHLCPHDERTLESARLAGNGTMLRCAYHNYTFKLATGLGVNCPGYRIDVYEVKEEHGRFLVRPASVTSDHARE